MAPKLRFDFQDSYSGKCNWELLISLLARQPIGGTNVLVLVKGEQTSMFPEVKASRQDEVKEKTLLTLKLFSCLPRENENTYQIKFYYIFSKITMSLYRKIWLWNLRFSVKVICIQTIIPYQAFAKSVDTAARNAYASMMLRNFCVSFNKKDEPEAGLKSPNDRKQSDDKVKMTSN